MLLVRKSVFHLAAVVTLFSYGCSSKEKTTQNFLDTSLFDSSVSASKDFFQHTNGKWIEQTVIPDDQTRWGGFTTLHMETQKKLQAILEDLQKNYATSKDEDEKKLGAFFASGMDTATIDKKGYEPIKSQLEAISKITTPDALLDYVNTSEKDGYGFLFTYGVWADEKNSNMNLLAFYQTGINLPDREYYLDAKNASIKEAYKLYVSRLFTLIGKDKKDADVIAGQILDLETKIASSHKKAEDLRDPNANYNKVASKDLKTLVPTLDWDRVLKNTGLDAAKEVNIAQPAYYKELGALLKKIPLEVWKNKVTLDLLHSSAAYLSKDFRQVRFDFVNKTLYGQKAEKERWEIVTRVINDNLSELLGKIYVSRHFSPEAKKRMEQLIDNLFVAYKARIEKLDWMSAVTKEKALKKLSSITRKIGYPDVWKKYDDINAKADDYFGNVLQGRQHAYHEALAKIGKPVDKKEWGMSPSEVNAYYNPNFNEIVFPAAILQFPFFDLKADDAINYGGIGMVIGHEITHGFDDQGKEYDAEGNLANWWTKEDETAFNAKANVLGQQYSAYSIADGFNVNGKLTMGENIADLGGLTIAYDAFQMTEQAKKKDLIDGLTPNERFFLSFAQIWRTKVRPEMEKVYINIDPHSPAKFRVNGPLANFDEYYRLFGEDSTSSFYRKSSDRVRIW